MRKIYLYLNNIKYNLKKNLLALYVNILDFQFYSLWIEIIFILVTSTDINMIYSV